MYNLQLRDDRRRPLRPLLALPGAKASSSARLGKPEKRRPKAARTLVVRGFARVPGQPTGSDCPIQIPAGHPGDPLAFPDRAALLRALAVARNHSECHELALVVIALDDFATLSLTFGATFCQTALRKFALKLRQVLPAETFVARLDHNTFAAVGRCHALEAADLRHALAANGPSEVELKALALVLATVPLGDAPLYPVAILDAAMITLHQAAANGCDQHLYYDPQYQRNITDRYQSFLRLRSALDENRIEIALQPQVDLATGRVVALEALARLRDHDGRWVAPCDFVPLAESTGLILPLGQRVVELACAASEELSRAGFPLRIAINLSALQFAHTGHIEGILDALRAAGSSAEKFEIEITESLAMQSFETVQEQLLRFRELGVTIAIDDFGTGFSSLSYLLRLPIDRLKIDRSFMAPKPEERILANSILHLGRKLGLPVVAEGVEDKSQAAWLKKHGCDRAQGFLFARPMPIDVLKRWLHEHHDE